MKFREAIKATPQTSEGMQPGNGSLDEPAELPQAATMLPIPIVRRADSHRIVEDRPRHLFRSREGVQNDDQLKGWMQRAVKFVGTLPAK